MTSKQKAKELIEKFKKIDFLKDFEGMDFQLAKQCALIAVDEAINVCPFIDEKVRETEEQLDAYSFQFVSYWEQVKQEIKEL